MIIDYLGHSGFLVETETALLLFDYFRGDLSILDGKPPKKPLFVFVSHAHADHFNPKIFSIAGRKIAFLLAFDLRGNPKIPKDRDVRYLDADRTCPVGGLGEVTALRSTDEGIAFLVKTPDATLFHAGDLHLWDWPGEDPAWLSEQETVFRREIGKLSGVPIDAAFAVLDDRLEEHYANGLLHILSVLKIRYVLPMHFWKDDTVISRFKALPQTNAQDTVILDTAHEIHWEIS